MKTISLMAFAVSLMVSFTAYAGWGAIAVDDRVGEKDPAYGVGGGDTKAEANKNAMKFCKEASGTKCELAVSYEKCGAYASSKKFSGTGTAATEHDAKKKALTECNNSSCRVLIADCNS